MSRLQVDAGWRARLQAATDKPPRAPRAPLLWQGTAIGSVEPPLLARAGLAGGALVAREGEGWAVRGDDLTASLAAIAEALRTAGLAHVWRNEQLGVRDAAGRLLGTVERAVARPLGIATHAVHLVALDPEGRHWVQRRSLAKPDNPGLWDTLVGGMVPAADTPDAALARETWEEAGLRLQEVQGLAHGGFVRLRMPARVPMGYLEERLDWFRCTLPGGVVPVNRDGEVAEFRAMPAAEVAARMERGEFCPDAARILLEAFG